MMKNSLLALALLSLGLQDVQGGKSSLHEGVMKKVLKSQTNLRYLRPLEDRPRTHKGKIECVDGQVVVPDGETYDCAGIDLLSFITSDELVIPGSQYIREIQVSPGSEETVTTKMYQSSDIWGWYSEKTNREFTLLTMDTGLVVIDSTDPEDPCVIAKSHSARTPSPWGDVKVVGDFAYTIKDKFGPERGPKTGMEVYDLTKFDEMDCKVENYEVPLVDADWVTPFHGSCHNVVSNTETGRVYSVGCRDTCDGGLVIMDVTQNPLKPEMIGCVFEDGYTHDAQCVKYSGPDKRYTGQEICFAFNEETLTIWDVTDASNPDMISRIFYDNQAYSHQGWLNMDMTKVMLDDELDELCNQEFDASCEILVQDRQKLSGKTTTTTNIFDVSNLREPFLETVFDFADTSIDHNLYVWGAIHHRGWGGNKPLAQIPSPDFAFMNNYMAGLRVVDISNTDPTKWTEVKHFDITNETVNEFFGVWSGYMHPSGVYAMSSIEKGVFFVDTNTEFVAAPALPEFPPRQIEQEEEEENKASPVLYVFFVLFLIGTGVVGFLLFKDAKKNKKENKPESEGKIQHRTL